MFFAIYIGNASFFGCGDVEDPDTQCDGYAGGNAGKGLQAAIPADSKFVLGPLFPCFGERNYGFYFVVTGIVGFR